MATRHRDPEWWLVQFGTQFCLFLFVMLVLMIAITPIFHTRPLAHQPPRARSFEKSPEMERDLNIYVHANGDPIVDNEIVTRDRLAFLVRAADDDAVIRIHPDRRTPFGGVRTVAILLRDQGRPRFVLMVNGEQEYTWMSRH